MSIELMSRDDLAAIVAKLPKTADGVPIVPGMKLWSSYYEGVFPVSVTHVASDTIVYDDNGLEGSSQPIDRYGKFYATRDAAMAAWPTDFAGYKAQPGNENAVDPYALAARPDVLPDPSADPRGGTDQGGEGKR